MVVRARVFRGGVLRGRRGRRWWSLLAGLLAVVLVTGLFESVPSPVLADTVPAAGEYVPLTPARIVDAGAGLGLSTYLTVGTAQSFQATGRGGIPTSGVSAVVLTVNAASSTFDGWLVLYPQGSSMPATSSMEINTGKNTQNTVITKVGPTGQVTVMAGSAGSGTTNVLADVQGYYTNNTATTSGSTFVALTPDRVYSTLDGTGGRSTPLGQGTTVKVPVLGRGGVPSSGVSAVAVNITAKAPSVYTWLEAWSGAVGRPTASSLDAYAGTDAAALVQVPVASDGTFSLYNAYGSVDVLVDVEGYYLDSGQDAATFFVPMDATRILSTRGGGINAASVPVSSQGVLSVPVWGVKVSGTTVIPNDKNVTAVVLAVHAVHPAVTGYLKGYPEGVAPPAHTEIVSYQADSADSFTGTFVAKVGPTGRVSLYASGQTDVIVDLEGYFYNTPRPAPPAPGVSSSVFPNAGWAGSGASGSVSLSMTSGTAPGVRQYRWALDDPSLASPGVVNVGSDNATGSVSLTPADGWHTLYVQAANTAGNTSPVTSYTFGVGVGLTSPANDARTTRYVRLNARASTSFNAVTWQYRRAAADAWATITPGQVTNAGTALTAWPVATTTSGSSAVAPELVWDASTGLGGVDGTALLRACFTPTAGGSLVCNTDASAPTLTLDKLDAGGVDASTSVGVGDIDLLTGNLALAVTDGHGLGMSVARTFDTLDPSRATDAATGKTSVFGPGWSTGLYAAGSSWTGLSDRGSTVLLTDVDGATTTFAKTSSGSFLPSGDDADSGLTLNSGTPGTYGPGTWTVADLDGNSTRFAPTATLTHTASASIPNAYQVDVVSQPGSGQSTGYTYDGSGRPTQILAPVPAGASCTGGSWTAGCRALLLAYGTSGDANGRLTAVTYRTTDASGSLLDVDVACYAYDSDTRLAAVWDPRDGTTGSGSHPIACSGTQYRPTTYAYNADGRIASITPPGLAAWAFGYDGSGRLITVTRTHDAAYGSSSETISVAYAVATTADTNNPAYRADLSAAAVAGWGQVEAPVTATAVFGPGHPSSGSDLRGATVSYLNAEGRTVNTAQYSGTGAAGWHIDTTDYDSQGNVVRSLSAANREEALNPDTADPALKLPNDGNPATTGDSAAAAAALSTVDIYRYDATGTSDLVDSFGPWHLTRLPNGTVTGARAHIHNVYDTGAELAHPAGGVLHLVTSSTVGASLSQQPVATNETDVRTTSNDYALSTSDATGWTFEQPMRTTTDPGGLAISTVTRFDPTTGAVIETRQPKSSGSDAGTTTTVYYTAGTNTADPECGNKPAWATLACVTGPAAQPGVSGLPGLVSSRTTAYDYLSRPVTVVETVTDAGGTQQTRTTNATYTAGGYGTDMAGVTVSGGLGVSVPDTSIDYDPATGLAVKTSAAATATQAATSQTTGYDDFGRVVSFKDNDQATGSQANTTSTTYNGYGLVATVTDAHSTTTYTYNQNGEYRNLSTTMNVSGVGDFTAGYDPGGSLATQTWPNGLTQTVNTDETGAATGVADTANGRTWLAETNQSSIHGQTTVDEYTGAGGYGGTRTYAYDQAGRLTTTFDELAADGTCTTRTYGFDKNSNRTSSAVYSPAADGSCQTSIAASSASHGYDIADRLQPAGSDAGLVYDAFGRITTMPSADTGNAGGAATISYYVNDLVHSQTQGGVTDTWTLDAGGHLAAWINSSNDVTKTNHYDQAGSDSPAWIAEDTAGASWTRNIVDLFGGLAAICDQAGTLTWQVRNLHGDTVATASNTDLEPSAYYRTDEYGQPLGTAQPARYGWLGGKQRSHDDLAGLTLMGVRLYSPTLGHFLTVDPVYGGNANAYTYPVDPIKGYDLDGKRANRNSVHCGSWWWSGYYCDVYLNDRNARQLADWLQMGAAGSGAPAIFTGLKKLVVWNAIFDFIVLSAWFWGSYITWLEDRWGRGIHIHVYTYFAYYAGYIWHQ